MTEDMSQDMLNGKEKLDLTTVNSTEAQPHEGQSEDRIVSITEAAKINNVTRQAIYVAIKLGKLRACKVASRWTIDLNHLEDYRRQKYSRAKSMYEGELLFDNARGCFSVNQVARMLSVPAQKIYYATRVGMLKAYRKGAAWVIHMDDVNEYRSKYVEKKADEETQVS